MRAPDQYVSGMGKCEHLFLYPIVSSFESIPKPDRRFPPQALTNLGIVAVASVHSFWRIELVAAFQLHAGNVFHDVDQLINGDEFARPKIQWLVDFAFREGDCASDAVVDVHKAACLVTVAPDLNLVVARKLRFEHLAAYGRRRLLAASHPGALWTVHVVITCNSALQTEIFLEMPAHALTKQLFPSVTVLGERRVGVGLLQR